MFGSRTTFDRDIGKGETPKYLTSFRHIGTGEDVTIADFASEVL